MSSLPQQIAVEPVSPSNIGANRVPATALAAKAVLDDHDFNVFLLQFLAQAIAGVGVKPIMPTNNAASTPWKPLADLVAQ